MIFFGRSWQIFLTHNTNCNYSFPPFSCVNLATLILINISCWEKILTLRQPSSGLTEVRKIWWVNIKKSNLKESSPIAIRNWKGKMTPLPPCNPRSNDPTSWTLGSHRISEKRSWNPSFVYNTFIYHLDVRLHNTKKV